MWSFFALPIVTREDLDRALRRAGVPEGFVYLDDPARQDAAFASFGRVRARLYSRHIASLPRRERQQIAAGTHPSQNNEHANSYEAARPAANQLQSWLAQRGFDSTVVPACYHMGRIVLSAVLTTDPEDGIKDFPWLIGGFEAEYGWPESPTAATASCLKPV